MERMTYAQAVGEQPIGSPAFVAGDDFDPFDEDEVEVVKLASERHRYDRLAEAEREIAALQEEKAAMAAEIARLRGESEEE